MERSGARPAVALWSRTERRRRWKSLVLLGVLAGLAGGLVTAALEGANRTSTSYPRMREELQAADAVFYPSQVGIGDADLDQLSTIPEVAAWGGFGLMAGQILELPPGVGAFVLIGDEWFDTVERADVVQGRLPDPARDDELIVNEATLDYEPHVVGKVLTLATLTPEEYERYGDAGPPDWTATERPPQPMTVVGVVRQPMDPVISFASGPLLMTGPGWAAAHADDVAMFFRNAVVRLHGGAADVTAFKEHIGQVYGRDDIPVQDLADDVKRVQNSISLERTALLLFAAAVLAASLVLVGQAFVRSAHAGADSVPTLNGLGLAPRELVAGLAVPHVVTVAVAAVTTVLSATLMSWLFPIGLARRVDPDVGMRFRFDYASAGLGLVVVLSAVAAVVASWLAVRSALGKRPARRTRVVGAASRAGASVPASVGASLALEQPARAGGAQVRPALVAAIAGVLGVVGAFTLVNGIDDALANPSRAGLDWQVEAYGVSPEVAAGLRQDDRVDEMGAVQRVVSSVDGRDAPIYSIQPEKGNMSFTVLDGRAPAGPDEVLLGARTSRVTGGSVGDTVTLGDGQRPFRVVGIGLLMPTPHSSFDEGALVSPTVLEEGLAGPAPTEEDRALLIKLVDPDGATAMIQELAPQVSYSTEASPVQDVTNLANVRRLPFLLAGFLVLLGLGAAGHALLTVSRRRRKELAVLRSLGLTPRQAGSCVAWQAVVVAGVALVIGIPLGLIAGREAWRFVANDVPLVYVGPGDPTVLALAVPLVLGALLLLALLPARGAARFRTAEVLRTE